MQTATEHSTGQHYPLEWLDLIITVTLNPAKTNVEAISTEQAECLCAKMDSEVTHIKSLLKNKVFSLNKQNKIRLLIRHYHSTLILLLDHAIANGKHPVFLREDLKSVQEKTISGLDELLSFIETRFAFYLGMDERVPVTYLAVAKEELALKLAKVQKRLVPSIGEQYLLDIATGSIADFVSAGEKEETQTITFRDVQYHRELLKCLEQLEESDRVSTHYTLLEETLICVDFNHRAFINAFTQKTADRVNMQEHLKDRISLLALYQKELKQLIPELDKTYLPGHPSLHVTLDNWFGQELFFLEKQLHLDIKPIGDEKEGEDERRNSYKLLCTLSEDQLGIILKAADDLKIIISRSLSNIFNQLVPYLSTPYKEDLSPDSMRSHTYSIEERDKQIVIETLLKMIEKIKEY